MKVPATPLLGRISSASTYLPRPFKRRLPADEQPAIQDATTVSGAAEFSRNLRRTSRLCNTFYLAMPADEALQALKKLTLERFSLEFVTIPAAGGCVVAVFAPSIPEPDFFWRFRIARQQHDMVRLLTSLGATAV